MQYSFIAYVFLCIVVGFTVFQRLSGSGRMWAAILSLILFVLIFVFYGMRWFRGTDTTGLKTGSWPPIINMCPDYLVYFKQGNLDTCIDLLGVNRSGGILKPWTQEDSPTNPPADTAKYFNYVYKPGMSDAELKTLCNAAQQVGLTWEGITNGESCTFQPKETVQTN